MKIREIMNAEVTTAGPESTIEEIARLMKQDNTGTIPVVDSNDVLCGVVTERDIVFRCVAEGHDASTSRAEDILAEEFECVAPDDDAEDVAERMREKHVQQLPAVSRRRLVGMISLDDIMQAETGNQSSLEALIAEESGNQPAGESRSGKRKRVSTRKTSAARQPSSKSKHAPKSAKQQNAKVIPIRGNDHPGSKRKKVS